MKRKLGLLMCVLALTGCASSSAVRSAKYLPVKQVVLYRSGVGYFERSGSFDGKSLKFSVRKSDVGDFLASLTAVDERGGGAVQSIAFEAEEKKKAPVPPPAPPGELPPLLPESDEEDQRVDVQLELSKDGDHTLDVSYVVGSPIWRPSYRVVLDEGQAALLQAWAVVQNLSGEDWKDIRLALTTGAPISFRSDLGTPITPERPLVTDTGEVVTSVPMGDVALAQGGSAPPPAPPPAEPVMEESRDDYAEAELDRNASAPMASRSEAKKMYSKAAAPMPMAKPQSAPSAQSLEQSVVTRAAATDVGAAVTRYDVGTPVTIPNGGSTMVAIVSARVPGEKTYLFAPDGGVALSQQHPFAVLRLTNSSGAVLEKGPISVMSEGSFLGQGMLDTLPKDAQAFIPFALDKSLVVERSEGYGEEQGALIRVQRGMVTMQRYSQRTTEYRARNGSDADAKLYVRHARWGEAELVSPPEGSELLPNKALVPVLAKAHDSAVLKVVERTPVRVELSFIEQPAADAVAVWLTGVAADHPASEPLKRALAIRDQLVAAQNVIYTAEQEHNTLQQNAEETRANLKSIEKVKSAQDLRSRLVTRLKQLDARIAELTKQIVDARTKQSELTVRLNEALDSVTLDAK